MTETNTVQLWTLSKDDHEPEPGVRCSGCALEIINSVLVMLGEAPAADMDEAYGVVTIIRALRGSHDEFLIPVEHGTCAECGVNR
jgi:hypothetical protein